MTVSEPTRDLIGRVLYEEPAMGRDWYEMSEQSREPWRRDADRVIIAIGGDPRRARGALLWLLGHIEHSEQPDMDKMHDATAWGLGKQNIRNTSLREQLEGMT